MSSRPSAAAQWSAVQPWPSAALGSTPAPSMASVCLYSSLNAAGNFLYCGCSGSARNGT